MLGSLSSLTNGGSLQGGAAGPSGVQTRGDIRSQSGFTGGHIHLGTQGMPWWLIGALAALAVYAVTRQ